MIIVDGSEILAPQLSVYVYVLSISRCIRSYGHRSLDYTGLFGTYGSFIPSTTIFPLRTILVRYLFPLSTRKQSHEPTKKQMWVFLGLSVFSSQQRCRNFFFGGERQIQKSSSSSSSSSSLHGLFQVTTWKP